MKLKQDQPGLAYYTDDTAKLYFRNSGSTCPGSIIAYRIGHVCINSYIHTVHIDINSLEFLAAGLFGPARPTGYPSDTKWTGNHCRFGIYVWNKKDLVILRVDGGGTYAYYVDQLEALDTWRALSAVLSSELLWDVCTTLTHTFHRGMEQARHDERKAFVEGRMKKRRRDGKTFVEVLA